MWSALDNNVITKARATEKFRCGLSRSWWRGRTHKLLSAPLNLHLTVETKRRMHTYAYFYPIKHVITNSVQRKTSKLVPAAWTRGPGAPAGTSTKGVLKGWKSPDFPPHGPLLSFGLEYADKACFIVCRRLNRLQNLHQSKGDIDAQPSLTLTCFSIAAIWISTSTTYYYLFFYFSFRILQRRYFYLFRCIIII